MSDLPDSKHESKATIDSASTSTDDITTLTQSIHQPSAGEGRWGENSKTLGEPIDVDAALEEYEEYATTTPNPATGKKY
jgi:hypothetical protein